MKPLGLVAALTAGSLVLGCFGMRYSAGAGESARARTTRAARTDTRQTDRVQRPKSEWKQRLTPMQYYVTREKGTERPFTGEYCRTKIKGTYRCVCCGSALFDSTTKFESGTGWPSFYQPAGQDLVKQRVDVSMSMRRIEVMCQRCDAHLGHVFNDGPRPTGLRYCINSAALKLDPAAADKAVQPASAAATAP